MLTQLLKAVEQHTLNQQYPQTFKQRMHAANIGRLLDAMELLREYIDTERIVVPDRIRVPKAAQADSRVAQPLQPDVHQSAVQQPQQPTLRKEMSNKESAVPMLQVPTKAPEYLDQALIRLFEQAQKAAAE